MKGHLKQILFHTFVRQTQYALIVKSLIQLIKRHMQHSISKIAKYKHNTNFSNPLRKVLTIFITFIIHKPIIHVPVYYNHDTEIHYELNIIGI